MWYSMSKFGSSIQYGWSSPSGTFSSFLRSTGTSGSRSASTSVSRASVTGLGASLGSSTHTPPTWPVALAVSSARNAASSPVSCRISHPPGEQRTQGGRWREPGLRPGGQRQPVSDYPQRGGIDPEAKMTAADLHVAVQLGLWLDAGLPGDDAIAAGEDGRRGDADGLPDLLRRGHPRDAGMPVAPAPVRAVRPALPGVGERERAAERNHLAD